MILNIFRFFRQHKPILYLSMIGLFLIFGFFASKINLNEDISAFMPQDVHNERLNFVYKNIGLTDKIIVRISPKKHDKQTDRDSLIEVADFFSFTLDSLVQGKNLIQSVLSKIDQEKIYGITHFITQNIPYYLDEQDYRHIDSLLTPENIKAILENNKKILVSPAGIALKKNIIADPLHISSKTLRKLKDFEISGQYETYNDYIFSKKQSDLLIFITTANHSSETAQNELLVSLLDKAIAKTAASHGTYAKVSYFGAAPIAVTNAKQIKSDSYWGIAIAASLILVLLGWFFRNFKSLIILTVPVIFGAALSLAALYFLRGAISAIAVGAGSIIFGIAINYALHYLIHKTHEPDEEKSLKEIASPMIIGSITTVGAFLSLLFLSADAMHDFGLFAAFSLLGTLVFVLIFLPHLVKGNKAPQNHFFDKISGFRFEKNKYIILFIIALTILFLFFSSNVSFDTNLNRINYMKPEQRQAFEELSNITTIGKKSMYVVSEGKNLNEALRAYERSTANVKQLLKTGKITGVSGIGIFLPSDSMQIKKNEDWNNFWSTRKHKLKELLISQGNQLGFKPESFNDFIALTEQKFTMQPPEYFAPITDNFVKDYLIIRDNRAMALSLLYTSPQHAEKLTEELTKGNSFVFDPSGISKSLINSLSKDFNHVLYLCGLIVLVFLTISFGRAELSIISFLPMVISWIWILGIMAIFNINFNIVNIILATFIFGLGDDYTIFMMDGMMNEYARKEKLISSYKTAVALSAITMFIGIGTLVFAKHPAMKSLGQVTIIGMISVVLISYVIPPFLFNYLTRKQNKPRLIPITFKQQLFTLYSFIVFLTGSISLTATGFFLFAFKKNTEENKLRYHSYLCSISRFVTRNIPMVKTRLINECAEDFEKPSVIICNHQSHLDLMFVLMLSPKIVILTNEWVWNSPFYGKLIKYADFYPIANGIENSINRLSTLVERGYSIVVFPEGTRSEDCSILRFHRGAFYLAEKLDLDVLPIVIHGIGHAFPKKEFLLRKGEITMKILDRIVPQNQNYGNNYVERSKEIRKLYKSEYAKLCTEFETPKYYSNLVFHNYIYKGAAIERAAKRELKKYDSYEKLITLLPSQGKLLHVNCGIGVFDLLCALVLKELHITAIDKNEENIKLAENCASKPAHLNYLQADFKNLTIENFDIILQFNPENQEIVDACKLHKKDLYLFLDKSVRNATNISGSNIVYENDNFSIVTYNFSKI